MSEKLNILFLSMHFRPEPCDTRTSQLAKAFAAQGHKATVLTSFPNYPFGKIYPGYKQKLVKREKVDGITLVRVPMFPDHSKSKKRRALSYLSFGASATLIGGIFTKRPDMIWIHHPPLTTAIAGWILAKLKRAPFVLEIHDIWPETLLSTGMIREGRITKSIRTICHFLHRRADALVVTSEGMKSHFVAQGTPAEKIFVMPQWADEAIYRPVKRDLSLGKKLGLGGRFNVFFTGNIGVAQGLDTLLDAAKRLKDLRDLQIVLVGAGVELERLRARADAESLNNVKFLGQFPPESMPSLFAWADATLLHLLHDPLFAITIPSKLQTYLAMGAPVLCGVSGDASRVVDQAESGLSFPPEDACGMARAIRKCFESSTERVTWAENARASYESSFSQATLVPQYEALFQMVVDRSRGRASRAVIESELETSEVLHPVQQAAQ